MLTGVLAAIRLPPLPGTIAISCVSGFCILLESSVSVAGATFLLRGATPSNASLRELRLLRSATDNLRPSFPILFQIPRAATKPIFVACQGSDAGRKQWKGT